MARKQPLPKTRRGAGSTVSPAALNAMTPPAVTRSLGDSLSAITGAVLIDLLMGQGKTLDEASVLTGIPRSRLYADGICFATAFMAKLDPVFCAAMTATPEENAQMEADALAQMAANGPDALYVPSAR